MSLTLPGIQKRQITTNSDSGTSKPLITTTSLDELFKNDTKISKPIENYLTEFKIIDNQKEKQHIILETDQHILKIFSLNSLEQSSNNLKYEFLLYHKMQINIHHL